MENDPNKKDSKGKRIFKKALRRNSKSSNNGQSSVEPGIGVSRSKSFENKHQSLEINDSTPLPKPDGTKEKADYTAARHKTADGKILNQAGLSDTVKTKKVEIHESHNETIGEVINHAPAEKNTKQNNITAPTAQDPRQSVSEGSKRNLKRKLEEESGAGTSGTSAGASDTDADDKDPSKDKKKKNRCAVCRKKVGLTGFECRCGGLFCAVHRYSDKHECSFDYRELGAQEIRRNNPVVVSQKIHKI